MSKHKQSSDRVLQVSPNIDFNKIKANVQKLKSHLNTQISDLKDEALECYQNIADNVSLLYGTKHYKSFMETIHTEFKNVNHVKPNSVGAWLIGCSLPNNLEIPCACTPICAGSIPVYNEKDHMSSHRSRSSSSSDIFSDKSWNWDSHRKSDSSSMSSSVSHTKNMCNHLVMLAVWVPKQNGFEFVDLNDSTHRSKAYIYTSHNVDQFPGFSKTEKNSLEKYGISEVMIYSYSDTSCEYKPITKGWTPVCDIKTRDQHSGKPGNPSNPSNPPSDGSSSSSSAWCWLIIILVIILILALIIYNRKGE